MPEQLQSRKFVILGAGPAGMGAAWELVQKGVTDITVIDRHDRVGGLARTMEFKGYLFDVGPHRFLTKYPEVEALWKELLGSDLLTRPRLTRIYYRNRFFLYPLKITDALWNLGAWQSMLAGLSYVKAQVLWRGKDPKNFADWTTKTFGNRMSQAFFRDYFTKVWGIRADEVGIEWAGQRIKGVSIRDFFGKKLKEFVWQQKSENIGSTFYYPRHGAGQFYEVMRTKLETAGVRFCLQREVVAVLHRENLLTEVETKKPDTTVERFSGDVFISSIPANFLMSTFIPAPPKEVCAHGTSMRFRAHIAVNMIVNRKNLFKDSWLYVQSSEFRIARIGNYGAFSPDMLGKPDSSAIGIEFYCFVNDDFWKKSDDQVIELALTEMVKLGFMSRAEFGGAFVVRHEDAYPTYYLGYKDAFSKLRKYLETFSNLRLIGRAGMYKYKDQDHALYTGMLTVRNLFGEKNDVWELGEEKEFFEEKAVATTKS